MADHPVSQVADWITQGSNAHYVGRRLPWQTRAFMKAYKAGYYATKYGGKLTRASGAIEGQFKTRGQRQKYFLGSNYNDMYRSQLTNYRSKMPRSAKKAGTNRKNIGKKGAPKRKGGLKFRKRYPQKSLKGVQKQIQDIRKTMKIDKSTHTHKVCDANKLSANVGRCNHQAINANTVSKLETYMANLRYYNPSVPGTLTTADASTGTYSRDVKFKNIYSKLYIRNNYQVPCFIKIYLCKAKQDTSTGVITTYTSGITDQVITAGADETDALLYLNDIERVKEMWDIDCVVDKMLQPGDSCVATHSTGEFTYDPSHVDTETDVYQRRFKAFEWVVRLEGEIAHDTVVGTDVA